MYLGLFFGPLGDEDLLWFRGLQCFVDGVASLDLDHGWLLGRDGFRGYYGCLIGLGGLRALIFFIFGGGWCLGWFGGLFGCLAVFWGCFGGWFATE